MRWPFPTHPDHLADDEGAGDPIEALQAHQRGISRWRDGDLAGAREDLDAAIRLDPGNAAALVHRGRLNRLDKRFDEAIADHDRALALAPGEAWHHYRRGWAHAARGRYDEAIADCDRAAALDPADADIPNLRGWARLRQGIDLAAALRDAEAALALGSPHPQALDVRAMARLRVEGAAGAAAALADLDAALVLKPDDAELLAHRGQAHAAAAADFAAALRLDPAQAEALDDRDALPPEDASDG